MAVDLGLSLFTSTGILLFLALFTTILRCIARIYVVKAFGADDYFMIATMVLYAHYCAWVFYGRSLDQGKFTVEIPPADVPLALRAFYFAQNSYILVACTLKLSIGTFLLRIMRSKTQLYTIYAIMVFITCASIALFLLSVFQCKPISHFWYRESPGTCLPPGLTLSMAYFQSSVIASSDFGFTIMPMFVVWRLQMDRFTKISVSGLMGLGTIAGVTTLLRIPFLKDLVSTANFFHATAVLGIMSSVEPGLGIIIGSAAATRPLFRLLFAKYHPFVSLTQITPHKSTKSSNVARTATTNTRDSTPSKRQDIEIGYPIPMENFNVVRDGAESGIGMRMIIEGGRFKKVCQKCAQTEEKCEGCGASIHTVVGRASGESHSTLRNGEEDLGEGVIYKDVAVERVVEFLTKK